jgi:hypothetical protein
MFFLISAVVLLNTPSGMLGIFVFAKFDLIMLSLKSMASKSSDFGRGRGVKLREINKVRSKEDRQSSSGKLKQRNI